MKISILKDLMQIKPLIFHLDEYRLQANKTCEIQVQYAPPVLGNQSCSALMEYFTCHLHWLSPRHAR